MSAFAGKTWRAFGARRETVTPENAGVQRRLSRYFLECRNREETDDSLPPSTGMAAATSVRMTRTASAGMTRSAFAAVRKSTSDRLDRGVGFSLDSGSGHLHTSLHYRLVCI